MLHQQLNHAVVQQIIRAHRVNNVLKDTVVHILWSVFIWVNVGHVNHCAINDQTDAIEILANARYVFILKSTDDT